ncbi:uncharacterized protein LOC103517518 [Diaphorina citri]|uniref:Uncharacterized protein LOC103517518 n=1 Tax=Diaphorina citri TaxID=121845 RepID=A0A1S4ELD1_DIACI|nr:uncharacterized protein LOC103517518 [Diaphorina citri]
MSIAVTASGMSVPMGQEEEDAAEFDYFPTNSEADAEKVEEFKREAEKVRKLKRLFEGLKVFLNREVPREPLTLALRSFGAQVSWDKTLFVGATFPEDDESITHQIVDRPSIGKQYISRYYVQPQWVFDSINAKQLAPVEKYFIGVTLPPHLSPFIDTTKTEHYVPPEAEDPENERLRDPKNIQTLSKVRKGPRQVRAQEAEEAKKRAEEQERLELENAKHCSDTEDEGDEKETQEGDEGIEEEGDMEETSFTYGTVINGARPTAPEAKATAPRERPTAPGAWQTTPGVRLATSEARPTAPGACGRGESFRDAGSREEKEYALRDLDDALTLCILIGRMPGLKKQRLGQDKGLMELCQRLPVEFMHAVIHARALRKVRCGLRRQKKRRREQRSRRDWNWRMLNIVVTLRTKETRKRKVGGASGRTTQLIAQHKRSAHKLSVMRDSPHVLLSVGEDGRVLSVDIRESASTNSKEFLMMRKGKGNCCMPLYSVASNPLNSNEFIVAGEDTKVHLFDKRFVFTKNAKPLKKFCPHTIIIMSSPLSLPQKKKMAVKAGKETPADPGAAKIENYRQRKMAERMIPNKYKRLYKIMMDGRKKRVKELNHLKLKRYTLDELKEEQERAEKGKVIAEQSEK